MSQREKDQIALGALSAVMPMQQAKQIVGYSTNSNCVPALAKETSEQIRERLQQTEGYTLEDSAKFYKDLSLNKKVDVGNKIRSRTRLDTILGHDSPQKIDVNQKTEVRAAIGILGSLSAIGLDLARLKNTLETAENPEMLTQNVNVLTHQSNNALINNKIDNNSTDIESNECEIEQQSAEPGLKRSSRSKRSQGQKRAAKNKK